MSTTTKTIKASVTIKKTAPIKEIEQENREYFGIRPKGGIVLSSGRGEGTAELPEAYSEVHAADS